MATHTKKARQWKLKFSKINGLDQTLENHQTERNPMIYAFPGLADSFGPILEIFGPIKATKIKTFKKWKNTRRYSLKFQPNWTQGLFCKSRIYPNIGICWESNNNFVFLFGPFSEKQNFCNLQTLAIEMFKVSNIGAPKIFSKIFSFWSVNLYILRHKSQFDTAESL